MMNAHAKKAGGNSPVANDSWRLKKIELEIALESGHAGGKSFAENLQRAADVAGGEILFLLPSADGIGSTGLLRLVEGGAFRLLQVRTAETGFIISEEAEIDADLLGFARASIDVLERLRADRQVIAPLTSAAH